MEIDKTTKALLYLMGSVLHGNVPEPVPELDYDALYTLSERQSVVAMTAMALESGNLLEEPYVTAECRKKWKDARVKAVRKNILLDAEREKIFKKLEEEGVWYLPLKGAILKDMYPKMGMRQMADNDILFDKSYRDKVYEYMIGQGYETEWYDPETAVDVLNEEGDTVHDSYLKKPIYNFEMHMALFGKSGEPQWRSYYKNVKERLQKDEENNYGYHFRDEDFYIYMTTHACKHFNGGGHGLRNLMDIYVFLDKKRTLDWSYIEKELEVLEISEHEKVVRGLAEKLFGENFASVQKGTARFSDKEQEILKICLSSGTYGTQKRHIENELKKMKGKESITAKERLKYLFRRLIPEEEILLIRYPKLARKKYLQPLCVLIRMGEGAIHAPKRLWNEFTCIWKAKKDR